MRFDQTKARRRIFTAEFTESRWFTLLMLMLLSMVVSGVMRIDAQEGSSGGSVCPGFQTQLAIGAQGTVLPGAPNNLRENPSTSAARIGSIPGGDGFVVIDGPECNGGYTWWLVQYRGTTGWTVEGTTAERYVTTGAQSSGGGVLIAGGNLRAVPSELVSGISFVESAAQTYSFGQEICVSQPDGSGSFRAVLTSGIGAYALQSYASDAPFAAGVEALVPLESGAVVADVSLLHEGDQHPLFGFSPAICVVESSGSAEAISPTGESVAPTIQGLDGVTQVQLPARAYIEPGDWRLRVGDTVITVQIPEPPRLSAPFEWRFHDGLDERDGFVILGGYTPDDQIVVITNDGEIVQTSPNAQGYAAVPFNGNAAITAVVPQSGQHVDITMRAITVTRFPSLDQFLIPSNLSRDILYNAVWLNQPFDAAAWTCPGAMPIRMAIGGVDPTTYTLTIDRLNIRQTPGANGTVVHTLSRGDVVQVIDGVACADDKTWWHVGVREAGRDVFPFEGWVAEGEGGQYFFEPVLL